MRLLSLRRIRILSFLLKTVILLMLLRRQLLSHITLRDVLALILLIIIILWWRFANSKVLSHAWLQNRDRLTLLQSRFELKLGWDALKVLLLSLGRLDDGQVKFLMTVQELLRRIDVLFQERFISVHHFSEYVLFDVLLIFYAYEAWPALWVVILCRLLWPSYWFDGWSNPVSLLCICNFIITNGFCHFSF